MATRTLPAAVADPSQRAFVFLKHLAADLSAKEISFPTFVDATMKVRLALNDPNIDAERLSRIISSEPLLPARLVRVANSAAINPGGKPVSDVKSAVMRVGYTTVRSLASAVAMDQLASSHDLAPFRKRAEAVCLHSLEVATLSYVIAKTLTRINPDEAMFAGLVHDIGQFYLMSRAAKYPELASHPDELYAVIDEWHPSIGRAVLESMELPEPVLKSVDEHAAGRYSMPPKTLSDLVTLANLASRCPNPLNHGMAVEGEPCRIDDPAFLKLLDEHAEELRSLAMALKN